MSIQALSKVIESDIPEVSAKMLLVCIANAHNTATGLCCPSIDRLCKESGMSRSSVKRWTRWLVENGYLEVEQTHNERNRQQANSYRIIDRDRGFNLDPVQFDPQANSEPGEGFTAEPPEGSNCEPALKEPEEYRKKNHTARGAEVGEVERDFQETLWVDFPRHQNSRRLPALKAFSKLSSQDRTACIRGAVAYSLRFESDAADKRPLVERLRYVPHLVTWINQRGWETELEAAR